MVDDSRCLAHVPSVVHVLIVDDNAALAENLAELLEEEGHEVTVRHDAPEALAIVGCFEAYLLDVVMPSMSGWELRRELKRRCPSARFVLMSGYPDPTDRPDGEVVTPLAKPVPFDQLLQRLTA